MTSVARFLVFCPECRHEQVVRVDAFELLAANPQEKPTRYRYTCPEGHRIAAVAGTRALYWLRFAGAKVHYLDAIAPDEVDAISLYLSHTTTPQEELDP